MEQPARSPESSVRFSSVKDVVRHLGAAPIVVSENTPVTDLPARAAGNRECRTLAVVDDSGRLVGIIPIAVLAEDLLFQMMPEEFLGDVLDPEEAARLAREQHASTAGQLMQPPLSISAEAEVRTAVHALHQAGLEDLPVVDEHGRVMARFNLLDLVLSWWQQRQPTQGTS